MAIARTVERSSSPPPSGIRRLRPFSLRLRHTLRSRSRNQRIREAEVPGPRSLLWPSRMAPPLSSGDFGKGQGCMDHLHQHPCWRRVPCKKGRWVTAYNLKCPHWFAIDYRKNTNDYFCPCHNSTFALDGSITTENSQPTGHGHHGYQGRGRNRLDSLSAIQAQRPRKDSL